MIRLNRLHRICVALGCRGSAELGRLAKQVSSSGERFMEFRLDMLEQPSRGVDVIRRLTKREPRAIVLATCRRKENGGQFTGSIEQQIEILETAVAAGAALVDVEIETAEAAPEALEQLRGSARLILSYHNFERTPALAPVVRRLRKIPADIYKVATHAAKPSDNVKVLKLPATHPDVRLVVMAMGDAGMASRVLGPSRGSLFTFSAPDPNRSKRTAQPTAAGQITASMLRSRYRAQRLKPSTEIYGVLGHPVGHSMSPAIHNRAFQARQVYGVYLPFEVEAGKLSDFFRLVNELPVAGISVTIPHKQRVLRHLDTVDPLAKRIRAVNTVYREKEKLCGTNTDVLGVTVPLKQRMNLKGSSILVAGNGGAARAAIFAVLDQGARVTVTGRNPRRAGTLAKACGVGYLARDKLEGRHFDALIHATPLGMYPDVKGCFFPNRIPADLVFDMVYNPLETVLLKRARAGGKETISGLEMFLEQAAAQFETWTRRKAPRSVMRKAVLEALGAA